MGNLTRSVHVVYHTQFFDMLNLEIKDAINILYWPIIYYTDIAIVKGDLNDRCINIATCIALNTQGTFINIEEFA